MQPNPSTVQAPSSNVCINYIYPRLNQECIFIWVTFLRPDGYLYDKEAILECLLHQKRDSKCYNSVPFSCKFTTRPPDAHKMKEYERQKHKQEEKEIEEEMADTQSKIAKFLSAEKSIVSKPVNPFSGQTTTSESTPGTNVSTEEQRSKLPSFWIPSLTPDSKPTEIKKPVSTVSRKAYRPFLGVDTPLVQ